MSRGALISLVIALAVMLLIQGRHRPRIFTGIAVVAILGGIVLFLLPNTSLLPSMAGRLETISLKAAERGEVANDRTHQWVRAWKIFLGSPSGMGLGTVGYGAHLSGMSEHIVGDGIYFRVLAEQGVPGILAFVFTLLGVGWTLWRYLPICDEETLPLCIGMLAFHVGFCIHSIGANTFDLYYLAPMYWMMIGLCVSRIHIRRTELRNIARIRNHNTGSEPKQIAAQGMRSAALTRR